MNSNNSLWSRYGVVGCTYSPPWSIDYRHVLQLARIVKAVRPLVAVEIGSYRGHSSVAFLSEMESRMFDFHCVEINPLKDLVAVLEQAKDTGRVVLHTEPSWEADIPDPDVVFIDGDHRWPALADALWALSRNAPVIVMHDTCSNSAGIEGCWGAELVADILKGSNGRRWFCDDKQREGEWTHRGFGVSVAEGHYEREVAACWEL